MKRAVLHLVSTRPVWRIPDRAVAQIRRAFGPGWDVVHVPTATVSDGDGGRVSHDVLATVEGAEVYFGWGVPPAVVEAARGTLRWAHTATAGVGGSVSPALRRSDVILTNSREVHAEPMAEWAVAAVTFCLKGFHAAVAAQRRARWAKDDFTDGTVSIRTFRDTRVGLVGLGGVGRSVARCCAGLGMVVRGIRRHPAKRRPAGVRWVGGPAHLGRLAAESDVLVLAAPATAETRRMIDADILGRLPDGASLVNLARGDLLDEDALTAQLETGRLAGAVLDVFGTEPLPPGHPWWDHPRVLITPHVSAVSTHFWERETALIVENVARYLRGRRLRHIVNLDAGY